MIAKSVRKHDSENTVNMNLISNLLPVTLSNGVGALNNVNFVLGRTSHLLGLVPPFRELYNYAFYSSANAGDMVRTTDRTHCFRACTRLLNTIEPIFTPGTNPVDWIFTNLQDGKSSWDVLCYLTCNTTKKNIYLRGSGQSACTRYSTDGEGTYTPTVHSFPSHKSVNQSVLWTYLIRNRM